MSASQLMSGAIADLQYPNPTSTGSVDWLSKNFSNLLTRHPLRSRFLSFYISSIGKLVVCSFL